MGTLMYAVILAGGGGTRLWPLSRRARPKPFLPLLGDKSLFQLTLARITPLIAAEDVHVVADQRHLPLVSQQGALLIGRKLIGEPFGRNTAAAVALATLLIERPADDVMVVLPADHWISDEQGFRNALSAAARVAADGSLVTLGIAPTGPETGYGYILATTDEPGAEGARSVERFVEKPDRERATELLGGASGAWWNAGIFVWRRDAVLASLERHAPAIVDGIRRGLERGQSLGTIYEALADISIDRGLMEPASLNGEVRVVPADVGWSDLGSWNALHSALAQRQSSERGVVTIGPAQDLDSNDILVHATGGRLVVTVGLADTIVVDTPDVVLVCAADRAQEVRAIVDRLTQAKETDYL
jgi:mannose-1-phosphate guanylyltransferase/mannose-6-phosphate isomerase